MQHSDGIRVVFQKFAVKGSLAGFDRVARTNFFSGAEEYSFYALPKIWYLKQKKPLTLGHFFSNLLSEHCDLL
jgi:hypothetical protein